ncbi:beta-galactosidase [Horticoccus luteus]|uniref:Beta-galactosidase n=1 Tax=Horticoccus luteus TaxID=2862869 RepID=A0A8F9TWG3_9BACT|nr:beta-galactosidase [Horticoccus luteus]QYM79332.1 beta-galactosidase [Horticoccus luteus]
MHAPVEAKVEMRAGRPTLVIDGLPTAPLLYALTDSPGARWSWEEVPARNIALFAQQGVRLFLGMIFLEEMIGVDGRLDIALARRQVAGFLAAAGPDAKVMLRVHFHVPLAWGAENPDECVGYADGPAVPEERWGLVRVTGHDNDQPVRASFYSEKWREWARRYLTDFCGQLAATPEGDAVFGLQVAYGVYGEWHQFGFFCHDPDTGGAATRAFRRWLRNRYGSALELSAAWGRAGLTWEAVTAPDSAARERADLALLRDPAKQQAVIDYYTFLHEGLADAVIALAQTVREAWPRPIMTATFFGYFYCLFGRQAAGGHLAVARVLASPHVDALCASPVYTPGAMPPGGTGHSKSVVDAVRRAGKLWLDEHDRATSVTRCPWDPNFAGTIEDDVAVLRRNLLQAPTRGGGAWCFDFGIVAGTPAFARLGLVGWWDHPRLQAEIGRIRAVMASRHGRPYRRCADVLVLHDPWAFAHIASRRHDPAKMVFGVMPVSEVDPVSPLLTDGLVEALYRSGLIHDDALLSELPTLDLQPYKLVILATTPLLAAAQRTFLREHVAVDGRHLVLLGYAGWSDGRRVGAEVAGAWSGFTTRASEQPRPEQRLEVDGATETLSLKEAFVLPEFGPAERDDVLGRWANGATSALRRRTENATWWTFALPPNSPGTWRAIGRRAECAVVNEHDDTTLLGDGLLVVHSLAGGERTLRVPGGPTIRTTLPPRSTVVFDAESGEILLG